MAHYDQRGQRVNTQINAENIVIQSTPKPSISDLLERALQLLKAHAYEQAISVLNEAIIIDPSIPDVYYCLALASLKGKRPKLMSLSTVRTIEKHLQTATELDPNCGGHVYLLWALVKYDYYVLNCMFDRPPRIPQLLAHSRSVSRDRLSQILAHVHLPGNEIWEELLSR
jgi:tetratricopeptide (TPR) repeat protein